MIKLKKISELFKKNDYTAGNGLYADLSELMAMRHYVPMMRNSRDKKASSIDSGGIRSAFRGRGIEMEEIREYQFGDDVRDIDWRVTARMNSPYTKIYTQERNREIYAWLDLSPIMLFGSRQELKSVTASKLAAFLGWMALDNKDRFGCIIFDGANSYVLKSGNDRAYIAAICKKISDIGRQSLNNNVNDSESRLKSLKLLRRNASKGAGIFIISSLMFWDDRYNRELTYLAGNNQLFLVNVFDNLEKDSPPAGQYKVEFAGEKLIFDSSGRDYIQNYREYFAEKNQSLHDFSKKVKAQLIDFSQNYSILGNFKIF